MFLGWPSLAQPIVLPVKPAASGPAPSDSDLRTLIDTLENEAARTDLLARLKALQSVATPGRTQEETDFLTAATDTLNNEIAARATILSDAVFNSVESLRRVPDMVDWLWSVARDPTQRSLIGAVLWPVTLAGAFGLGASLLARLGLRSLMRRAGSVVAPAPPAAKVRALAAYLVVNLGALAAFLVATTIAFRFLEGSLRARLVTQDVLVAIFIARGIRALVHGICAVNDADRRLPAWTTPDAARVQRWMAWLVGVPIYGYFGLEVAKRLGLPWSLYGFMLHLLVLVSVVLLLVAIFRSRERVAEMIRAWGESSTSAAASYVPWRFMAANGHWILAGVIAVDFLVWSLDVPGGAEWLTQGLVLTLLALAVLRVSHVWLDRALGRKPAAPGTNPEQMEEPTRPQSPTQTVLHVTSRLLVTLVIAALLVQAWGFDLVGWLGSNAGRSMLDATTRIFLILGASALIAAIVNRVTTGVLLQVDEGGNLLHSNRTRTLASILRNLLLTLIISFAVLSTLAQIGVDTTALLAGAGVVGLAIGFGAQRLVQDLITGLFILLGDTIRVGDVVDLGGRAGVVEAMSMRTVTLRDYSGSVHTVPYSSIDVVTNMTKDFSYWVFDVAVAFKQDADRVMDVLREVDSQLRREWPFRRLILEPIEIAGLDSFGQFAMNVRARTKTRPGDQWKVGREFNRRLKKRFDELGIDIPVPQQAISIDGGARAKEDAADPGRAVDLATAPLRTLGQR